MLIVVSYDVATSSDGGTRRLRRVAKQCLNYGQRVQNSVFECVVDPREFEVLKNRILDIIDINQDSIRFYFLGSNWKSKVEHYGTKKIVDIEATIIL